MANPELQTNQITYGDALRVQAGKFNGSTVPSRPKPIQQPQRLMSAPPSSPKPSEQTLNSDRQPRGYYSPHFPYPANNVIAAYVENTKTIRRNNTFGQLALHTVQQAALYLTNPTNANIVNPLQVTGQLPSEGLIPTSIDAIWRDPIAIQARRVDSPTLGARIRANIGQLEGPDFARQFPPSVNQAIDMAGDVIMGALGIKNVSGNAVQNPKSTKFSQRLLDSNRLSPETLTNDEQRFKQLYQIGVGYRSWRADSVTSEQWATTIGGKDKAEIAKFYAPIQGGGGTDFSSDYRVSQFHEEGWLSNLGYKDETAPETNSAAVDVEPAVLTDNNSMVFPFYFESLNTFVQTPEKYITFQATFSNLKEDYRPNWTQKRFFGRTTAVYVYEFTDRTVSFDFIIHAPARSQMGVLKQRINWLARHVYPSYLKLGNSNSRIIFEAPIIKFTIGDLFKNTPGVIKSLTYDWDMMGNNRWELSKDMIMPQAVKASIQIDILHNKFMQNSAIALSEQNESSDFYEFIKPDKRGIEPLLKTAGSSIADFTPSEADAFAGESVYGK